MDLDLIFNGSHPCEEPGCDHTVAYDDEPYCFVHSPDEGSYRPGYSWKEKHLCGFRWRQGDAMVECVKTKGHTDIPHECAEDLV